MTPTPWAALHSGAPDRDSTRRLDLRLVGPAIACWLSAGVLVGFPEWATAAAWGLWLAAAALLVIVIRSRSRRSVWPAVALCVACAALAASVVAAALPGRFPPSVRAAVASDAAVRAIVTVLSPPSAVSGGIGADRRMRLTGELTVMVVRGERHKLSVPVVVYAQLPRSPTGYPIGSSIAVGGTLDDLPPGDAASVRLFARGDAVAVAGPPWWLAWANTLRAGFADAASDLPGDGGALLPGLALGDTSAVTDELDSAMKSSSLSHLTAVSGANCVIVIASIMMLGAALRLSRGLRITVALGALVGFVVLVTPEASVLRAATMATIVMLSMAAGRPGRGLPALALAVLLLVAADPWLSRSFGFTLSVLATAALLVLAGPLAGALSRWMPAPLAAVISIPLAAQVACQPVLVLLDPTLPLYGVPANVLAAPAAPLATVSGLLACLLLPWLPWIADAFLYLAWLPAAWIAAVARAAADLPGTRLPWWGGGAGVAAIVVVTGVALVVLLRGGRVGKGRGTAIALVALLVFVGGYAGAVLGSGAGRALAVPANWEVAACDVGQGDAVVVRSGGRFALVDVGRYPEPLSRCLRALGIHRLDLLVLTHYDADHVGGLDAVVGMVDVALVGVPENGDDERVQLRLAEHGATVRSAAAGDTGTLGESSWRVLWPVRDAAGAQTGNDGSVTIEFDSGGIRSLFLGDLGEESQRSMLAVSEPRAVDVVKVAHHGSADQSPELYEQLRAAAGLISVGPDNGYGHPTRRLLDMLRSAGTTALRTDRQGMLVVAPAAEGSRGLAVWTERGG